MRSDNSVWDWPGVIGLKISIEHIKSPFASMLESRRERRRFGGHLTAQIEKPSLTILLMIETDEAL